MYMAGKKVIKVIVVGIKKMGANYLRVLRDSSRYHLMGYVCFENELVDPKGLYGKNFANLEEVVNAKPDLVFITSAPECHQTQIEWFLKRQIPIFSEKPMAFNVTDAEKVLHISKDQNCFLAVGHIENFNPVISKLQYVLESNLIGKLIHINTIRVGGYPETVTEGTNVLLDLALHDIDIIKLLCGPIKFVGGMVHSIYRPDAIDAAEILLSTKDDLISASVHVNWITPTKIRKLRATGTHGFCEVDYIMQTCEIFGGVLSQRSAEPQLDYSQVQNDYGHPDHLKLGILNREPLANEIDKLADAFETGNIDNFCPQKALESLSITVEAIEKCNTVGRPF